MSLLPNPTQEPWLDITASRDFPGWLTHHKFGLAFSTYQSGKLFLLGVKSDGRLSVHERTFDRCMGLWASDDGRRIVVTTRHQIWEFVDPLRDGATYEGSDRLYIPKTGHTTADLDAHDVAVEHSGRIVFVNTKFSCLATLDPVDSFRPLWKPSWITKLLPEDRCHLNGLALEDGKAAYVTAVSRSDVADGWRERRSDGGVVVDVRTGDVIAEGLSMPHSPRIHDGILWIHNSGTGEFGKIDRKSGRFEPVAFCPGYARGLTFAGGCAIIGLSKPRHNRTFGGLALAEELSRRDAEARCGLHIIDLSTGAAAHWVRIEGLVTELYDVAQLASTRRPAAVGFKTDDIAKLVSIGNMGSLSS